MRKFLIELLGGKLESTNTLNLIEEGRRVGNSTRLIDKYVQDLFNEGNVVVYDHYNTNNSNNFLLSKFLGRLNLEHGFTMNDLVTKGTTVRFSDKYIKTHK